MLFLSVFLLLFCVARFLLALEAPWVRLVYTKITQFGLALLDFCRRDPPAADCAKPTFSLELLVKPTFWASWRPRRPQDQDGLQTGFLARKTASDGPPVSWRPRRPPDRPPGAQVGLWTGLMTPQTASDGPSPADKFTCRQDHLPTSPPASQVSPGAKRAFDACTFLPLTPYCRDSLLDKTAARRT